MTSKTWDNARAARGAPLRASRWIGAILALLGLLGVADPARSQAPRVCFKDAPLSPGAEAAFAEMAAAQAAAPRAAFADDRWIVTATNGSTGVAGDPVIITWGVAADGTAIGAAFPAAGEVPGPSDLIATFDGWYGRATWMALFQESFDAWTELTGVEFRYEDDDDAATIPSVSPPAPGILDVRADIRIGGHPIDGDFAIVAYAYPPDNGEIVLDTDDPLFFQSPGDNFRRLRNTLMHEIGHAMGLEHVCPVNQSKLMEPDIVTNFDGPQHDDLIAMQSIYGDVRENDDDQIEAIDLGLDFGETLTRLDLSIDSSSDEDWISLPDQPGLYVQVTVSPYGEAYSIADSDSNGSCSGVPSGFDNTFTNQDLSVEVLAADGVSVVAASDVTGAGGNESISAIPVPGGGFVRVVGDGASDVQIYDMSVEYIPEPSASASALTGLLTLFALARHRARQVRSRP